MSEPAFPSGKKWSTTDLASGVSDHAVSPSHRGMSIRTYLAAKAMQGWLAVESREESPAEVAKAAVEYADALIAELLKPRKDNPQ